MKIPSVLGTLLGTALLAKAEHFSMTPIPFQYGMPSGCTDFASPTMGDTCNSFAKKHLLNIFQFLAYNPQVGGLSGCTTNFYAHYWYCIGPNDGSGKPTTSAPPPGTTLVTVTPATNPASTPPSPPPSTTPASTTPPPPPATTPAPPAAVVSCPINNCWRAYEMAMSGARSSQSSWCTSVLAQTSPPITEDRFWWFPGIPILVASQCAGLSNSAAPVMSQYCSCFTRGEMDYTMTV